MTKRKTAAAPASEQPDLRPTLSVRVPRRAQYALATVHLGGEPVDAQVQWYPGAPWRVVPPGGEARFDVPDPSQFVTRVPARRNLSVTARVAVGKDYVTSDTIEVRINEVAR